MTLSKNKRRQVKIKVINIPKIIKNESVRWRIFINVDGGLVRNSFGNIGSCGGGIRR